MSTDSVVQFIDTFDRDKQLPDGDILRHRVRRETEFVRDMASFQMKPLTRETIITTMRFRENRWGPFAWWKPIAKSAPKSDA